MRLIVPPPWTMRRLAMPLRRLSVIAAIQERVAFQPARILMPLTISLLVRPAELGHGPGF